MDFLAADTEDDSPEVLRSGRSGFEKKVTQIAGLAPNGDRFYLKPKIKRVLRHAGFKTFQMDLEPFYNWLKFFGAVRCYFHNTRYDLGNLFPHIDDLDISMVGNRLISARWGEITFLDTFNLWPMALARVGDAVGIKKQKMDVRSPQYVFNDCAITRKAVQVVDGLCSEFGVDLPATLGSLCVQIWMATGGSNWHWSDELAREAYYGGRVELFASGGQGEILYTDINSLYPHVMTFPFPMSADDWCGQRDLAACRRLLLDLDKPAWGIATATLNVPECEIAPLPVERKDGSIYYPFGEIAGTYTIHEIRNAIKHGARLKELSACYGSTRAWPYYRKFVKMFYQRRKMESDVGRSLFLKLLLNNLYGQLGMSGLVTRSLLIDHWIEKDGRGDPVLNEAGDILLKRDGVPYGKKLLCEMQMPLPPHANYLHAAYVTSYARLMLQDFLRRVRPERLIYCDTDSLFFYAPGWKSPFAIGRELGQMKLEGNLTFAHVLGPKFYDARWKGGARVVKVKGVPNKVVKSGKYKSLAARLLKQGKLAVGEKLTYPKVFLEKGSVTFDQPFGLRESILFYDRQAGGRKLAADSRVLSVWREVEKAHRARYDKKRLVNGRFFPIAHCED